jgi:hypothetical protein
MATGKRLNIQDAESLATKNNGLFLSKEYKNAQIKYLWQCKLGHKWMARLGNVKYHGAWCPKCSATKRGICSRNSEDKVASAIKEKGFLWVSGEYKNNSSLLKIKCKNNHIVESNFQRIKKGDRCILCKVSCENIVRVVFETLLEEAFKKVRPDWLRISKNTQSLELDGYNEKLKIAFEYNGWQHYRKINFFGGDKAFNQIKKRDKFKLYECKKRDILLLSITPLKKTDPCNDAVEKIKNLLLFNGVSFKNRKITPSEIYRKTYNYKLVKLKEIALKRGGRFLLKHAPMASERGKWKCKRGHVFYTRIAHAERGVWCQKCFFIDMGRA